mmetsp:Transcript_36923/g.80438  ORF Transcript_36923/g.80438 Transcript_36923/m.80438 type:complete len:213 (-) Transcript_36923:192-830(-)
MLLGRGDRDGPTIASRGLPWVPGVRRRHRSGAGTQILARPRHGSVGVRQGGHRGRPSASRRRRARTSSNRGPGGDLRRRLWSALGGGGRLRGALCGPLRRQPPAAPAGGGGDVGRVARRAPPRGATVGQPGRRRPQRRGGDAENAERVRGARSRLRPGDDGVGGRWHDDGAQRDGVDRPTPGQGRLDASFASRAAPPHRRLGGPHASIAKRC